MFEHIAHGQNKARTSFMLQVSTVASYSTQMDEHVPPPLTYERPANWRTYWNFNRQTKALTHISGLVVRRTTHGMIEVVEMPDALRGDLLGPPRLRAQAKD